MNIIEHDKLFNNNADSDHLIIEAWKWAFSNRLTLGDPAFTPNVENITNIMISKDHATYIRSKIVANQTFPISYYSDLMDVDNSVKMLEDHGTMHLNVIDIYGNMVALTSTVNLEWGSKFVGPNTGIVYNNEMDDFATPDFVNNFGVPPAEANYIVPGKRPLSSMNPVIIQDYKKDPIIAVGASGGTKIITAPMQAIINVLSYDLNTGDAINKPRMHDQLLPEKTYFEDLFDEEIIEELELMGHVIKILLF